MGLFSRLKQQRRNTKLNLAELSDASGPGRILFVSHEATRTGAPKIILNILKNFANKTDAHLQTILHNGGDLSGEFKKYSEVDCLNVPRKSSEELSKKIRKLCTRHRNDCPILAVCNSMESRFIGYELHKLGIPVIFLVHELPSSYEGQDYQNVYDCSHRIVFPANAVREAAHERSPIPQKKSMVFPQGLLNPEFGKGITHDTARVQLRRELNLPDDALIVLGCGTLDLRKGIDHFANIARMYIAKCKLPRPVHFVWLGEGPRWTHSPYHYVMLDIEKTAAQGHVHFVGERDNVEPFFMGADSFLMTSRVDPFPCVLHEAMAAQLPIITFDRSGGAAEAVSGGAGVVVPYGDYQGVVDMLNLYATQSAISDYVRWRSLEKVNTLYDFDQYSNRIIQLAEETCGRQFASSSTQIVEPVHSPATLPHPSLEMSVAVNQFDIDRDDSRGSSIVETQASKRWRNSA